jgi:hypothetical protein
MVDWYWFSKGAREGGFGLEVNPPFLSRPVSMVTVSAIRWDLINEIMYTWVGMVFVVSFASCLDVAAISMDMGEALDTNKGNRRWEYATSWFDVWLLDLTF